MIIRNWYCGPTIVWTHRAPADEQRDDRNQRGYLHLVSPLMRRHDRDCARRRFFLSPQPLYEREVAWNEKNPESGSDQHPPKDRGAHDVLRAGAGAAREHQRYDAQDESKRGHEDG